MKTKMILPLLIFGLLLVTHVSAFTIESVNMPAQIAPGESANIQLEIKNTLDKTYESVRVSLNLQNLPFSPYQSSSEKIIEKIREDKVEEVEFTLISNSDAEAGIYKIPVEIRYNNTIESSFISITINSKPSIDLSSDNYLIKGKEADISIKIINKGLSNAKFMTINLLESSGFRLLSSDSVYIGDVDSNDFNTADVKLFVDKNAGSFVSIPVSLTYTDALNKQYTETADVQIRAYSNNEAISLGLIKKNNTGLYVLIILGLIVLYFVYRFIRKRLKKSN